MTAISIKSLQMPIRGRTALIALGVGTAAIMLAVLVGSLVWDRSRWISILLGAFVGFSSVFANWLTIHNAKVMESDRVVQVAGFMWMLLESVLMASLVWMRLAN